MSRAQQGLSVARAEARDLQADLDLAAASAVNVMLTATDAAERSSWARTIHDRGARRDGPFLAVNDHATPSANHPMRGEDVEKWFERATGGTLFIDHVGDLGPLAQDRIFSLLTERRHDRTKTTTTHLDRDVRIVAGSDRPLRVDGASATFSDALFYRLNLIHIQSDAPAMSECHESPRCPANGPRESRMKRGGIAHIRPRGGLR